MSKTKQTTVSILPCGAMTADLTWLLLAPGRAMRTRNDKLKPAEWVDVPSHCVLVDTPDGKLLWDTSCPRDWEERWEPTGLQDFFPYDKVTEEEYLDSRLNQLGLQPGDIDFVVLSHLHFDHAGNVNLFKETNARLVPARARPIAPNIGRMITGCGVGIDALASPICAHATMPPFTTSSGRTPNSDGFHTTRSAHLPSSTLPMSCATPWAIAGLMVYLAT